MKPGLLVVSEELYFIHQVFYKACDEFRPIDDLGLNCEVELDGEPVGGLAGLTEHFFKEHVIPGVEAYSKQHFLGMPKSQYFGDFCAECYQTS